MREIFRLIPRFAARNDPVLIVGETGTGKDLVARAIHRHSGRATGPFVDINCAAIPMTLFESELFGHERGAFTDARDPKPSKFELAHRGTLFLDEIGEMPLDLQAKLLRVVERRELTRLGGNRHVAADARLVVATNADLDDLIAHGGFRRDLYYRVTTLILDVPSLRQRGNDIHLLINYFLDCARREWGALVTLDTAARELLCTHAWPGNVRELDHLIRRVVAAAEDLHIGIDDLNPFLPSVDAIDHSDHLSLPDASARLAATFEAKRIRMTLKKHQGHHGATARALGIDVRTLYTKLIKLGIRSRTH